ncbi:transporter substrate-binding domain-containing protein [Shewanella algae]|nr:transporter substrate-binding domain-containing protein [Shewanella algae]MBO2572849.1 transporter substrate-binding domain-containing protein [Shewanella algae]MBO2627924.1 transporter substrate-binding domain-containing protein [Shewanella algae]QTE96177.1 transporter substrate-binding domain-containing protein [Shewanella algae]
MRMRSGIIAVLTCFIYMFSSTLAWAEAETKVLLAAEDSWPPFADRTGQGLSHQLITAAFSIEHIQVESLIVPYSRALMMARKGQVQGVFNVTRERSTEPDFLFGEEPLFVANASFYYNRNRPLNAQNKWQLPKGSVVGIIKGYEYGDEFAKLSRQLQLVPVASQEQLLNLLLLNRIDAAIMFDKVAEGFIKRMGVEEEILPAFSNHQSRIFLAFSLQNASSPKLAKALDEGLRQMKQSGQYQQIISSSRL